MSVVKSIKDHATMEQLVVHATEWLVIRGQFHNFFLG